MKNLELILNKKDLQEKLDIFPPDSAEDIRNKLELLEGEERLDKSAVKGLEEIDYWIKKWDKGFWGNGLGGGGSESNVKWHPNKEIVEANELLLIPSNYQIIFDEQLTDNGGNIVADGDLYIDNFSPDNDNQPIVVSSTVVTTNTTLTQTNGVIMVGVDATSGPVTVTLPSSTGNTAIFSIKKIDSSANLVTVVGTGGQTIDGAANWDIQFQWTLVSFAPTSGGWFRGL